jgi:hypothetical protein
MLDLSRFVLVRVLGSGKIRAVLSENLMDNQDPSAIQSEIGEEQNPLLHAGPEVSEVNLGQALARRIDDAPTIVQKAQLIWALPTNERHAVLGSLDAATVAEVIELQPDENIALLGNLPAPKFIQLVNLGSAEQGRMWLERAVTSGHLAALMLPALVRPRDLIHMLMTSPDFRRALPRLLNFNRANDMRSVLHPLEWKQSLDDLLLADAQELLQRAGIKNRSVRAILQSLVDFYPEAYLETVRLGLARVQYEEDHPDEYTNLTEEAFALPDFLNSDLTPVDQLEVKADGTAPEAVRPITEIVPAAIDPFLTLATSQLPEERRNKLEDELRGLLRQEIVAAGSYSQHDLMRAANRLLFQLRAGLQQSGALTSEDAAHVLASKSFNEVAQLGSRVAEKYRQKSLQLAGAKDWLDGHQKQFLQAMRTPEASMDMERNVPVFYISSRPNQPRDEWQPVGLTEIEHQLDLISAWAGLARAAFATAARVQTIFATAKTRTAEEACRRIVVALCLYRRWEPELVRPSEDNAQFRRQFSDSLGRLNPARQIVLTAIDKTPSAAWKPADAKEKARGLLMTAVDELEKTSRPQRPSRTSTQQSDGSFGTSNDDDQDPLDNSESN